MQGRKRGSTFIIRNWRGKIVNREKLCKQCELKFFRNLSNTKVFNKQIFCSKKCWLLWNRNENHYEWNEKKDFQNQIE